MNYLKISAGIFLALAASRFIPHPPNFIVTDFFIGFHSSVLFTWGSVIFIGFISQHLTKNITFRILGALLGACAFFIITNFGVWSFGSYGYTLEGLILCYTLAIPFFTYSLIATLIFSTIIETIIKLKIFKFSKKAAL